MIKDVLIPNPLDSDRQFERFYHLDIPGLEDAALMDELHALSALLWWRLPNGTWLRERVKALNAELYKRRENTRFGFSGKPKPKLSEGVPL